MLAGRIPTAHLSHSLPGTGRWRDGWSMTAGVGPKRHRPPPDPRTWTAVRRKLLAWGRANYRAFTWRAAGATAYEVAVAEVLLRRTTATAAARLYPSFISKFPDWPSLAAAPEKRLARAIKIVGLSNQRARDLKSLAIAVVRNGGQLPDSLDALLTLPGLGPYSARAVLSIAFGNRAAIVDSNVARVLSRLASPALDSASPKQLQIVADALVAPRAHRAFNLALLDLAAAVCRYGRPRCDRCPLTAHCAFFKAAAESKPPGKASAPTGKSTASPASGAAGKRP